MKPSPLLPAAPRAYRPLLPRLQETCYQVLPGLSPPSRQPGFRHKPHLPTDQNGEQVAALSRDTAAAPPHHLGDLLGVVREADLLTEARRTHSDSCLHGTNPYKRYVAPAAGYFYFLAELPITCDLSSLNRGRTCALPLHWKHTGVLAIGPPRSPELQEI